MTADIIRYAFLLSLSGFIGCQAVDVASDIAASTGAISAGQANVLKAGTKAAKKFTPENEYYIGRSVAATILTDTPAIDNPAAQKYINQIGQSLALASDMPETWGGYHFTITDSDEVNAFAAPGGLVMVSRELIKCCKNEHELAAVLAHEVAHVQLKHGISAIEKGRKSGFFATLAVEAGKEYGSEQLGQLTGAFEDVIKDCIEKVLNEGYSEKQEHEADKVAVEIMDRLGYSSSALVSVLETMNEKIADSGKGFGRTHPKCTDRIAEVKELVSRAPSTGTRGTQARFNAAMKSL